MAVSPKVGTVPQPQNLLFEGRDEFIKDLGKTPDQREPASPSLTHRPGSIVASIRREGPVLIPGEIEDPSTYQWPQGTTAQQFTILCDFDGTITPNDTTDEILDLAAHRRWLIIEKKWQPGLEITARECMMSQTMCLKINRFDDITEYLKTKVAIVDGFVEFLNACMHCDFALKINSDGYDYAIRTVLENDEAVRTVLKRWSIGALNVYSNRLHSYPRTAADVRTYIRSYLAEKEEEVIRRDPKDGMFFLQFPNGTLQCMAGQGTCKCSLARKAKEKRPYVIHIGNDITDCCAVQCSDYVFIKLKKSEEACYNALVKECHEKHKPFTTFRTSFDVVTKAIRAWSGK